MNFLLTPAIPPTPFLPLPGNHPTKPLPIHNSFSLDLTESLQLQVGLTHEGHCHLEEILP